MEKKLKNQIQAVILFPILFSTTWSKNIATLYSVNLKNFVKKKKLLNYFNNGSGSIVGSTVGTIVGFGVGSFVGSLLASIVGLAVGSKVGSVLGSFVGLFVGTFVGSYVGSLVGMFEKIYFNQINFWRFFYNKYV